MKHVIVIGVADLANGLAGDRAEVQIGFGGDFAADDDQVAFGVGLASNAAVGILGQAGVQHGVRDGIADFVRVAFADGLGRKDVVFAHGIDVQRRSLHFILTYQDKMIYRVQRSSTAFFSQSL